MSAPPTATPLRRLRELLPAVALLGLLFVTRTTLANHYVVPSGSMQPTLQPGDRVFVDMSAYGLRIPYTETVLVGRERPRRGDVVLLPSPATGDRLIKRIVGVGGDRVTIRGGHLSIDGRPAATADGHAERLGGHLARLDLAHGGGPDIDVVVPDGHVLVVGDHRGNSLDGRMFGFVRESAVYARARGVFWRRGDGPTWRPL